jgi:hypothetical protein
MLKAANDAAMAFCGKPDSVRAARETEAVKEPEAESHRDPVRKFRLAGHQVFYPHH